MCTRVRTENSSQTDLFEYWVKVQVIVGEQGKGARSEKGKKRATVQMNSFFSVTRWKSE